jgi:hypothetical protein
MVKFSSPRDEVLYRITLDGIAETIGDIQTWGHTYLGIGQTDPRRAGPEPRRVANRNLVCAA